MYSNDRQEERQIFFCPSKKEGLVGVKKKKEKRKVQGIEGKKKKVPSQVRAKKRKQGCILPP